MELLGKRARRLRRALHILSTSPNYVFGRFATVRRAYSLWRRVRPAGDARYISVSKKYGTSSLTVPVRSSGLLESSLSAAEHVERLRRRSFSEGLRLSSDAIQSLTEATRRRPLQTDRNTIVGLHDILSSPINRGDVAIASVQDPCSVPEVRHIAADEALVGVAGGALGFRPTRVSTWLFWSFANGLSETERLARNQTVQFHYDVDGLSFVYVNFYLVDTTDANGAHVLIEGSHRPKAMRHLLGSARLSDAAAIATYGEHAVRVVTGSAGTGFFEDSSCFHKALPPISGDRLMLQLRYQ